MGPFAVYGHKFNLTPDIIVNVVSTFRPLKCEHRTGGEQEFNKAVKGGYYRGFRQESRGLYWGI